MSELVITRICAISRINSEALQKLSRTNRERSAIAIKTAGKTVYSSNGHEYLSDSEHVVILPRGSSYNWNCLEKGECLMVEFEAGISLSELKSFKVLNQAEFRSIFHNIEVLWTFKKPAYNLKCIAGTYDMLTKLVESEMRDYRFVDKYDIIKPSLRYLEERYNDPALSNHQLAQMSGISEVYFRKIFTALYHCSPMKYIQNIRIEKAKDMLLCEGFSITDIAETVGFNSIYHFSKTFKKVTGYSPTEFSHRYFIMGYDHT